MAHGGVHLFLAKKLKKEGDKDYFLGNLIPDAEHLMKGREELVKEGYNYSLHSQRERFKEAFGEELSLWKGIEVHFRVDDYIHEHYIPGKVKKFGKWDAGLVHFLTEIAMDRVLARRDKGIGKFFDEVVKGMETEKLGERLERVFPGSRFKGSRVLKDGIEMLRVSNLTSWLRINQARKIAKRYNPFPEINPNIFKVFYMMKRIEREVEKDLEVFLEKVGEELKGKV